MKEDQPGTDMWVEFEIPEVHTREVPNGEWPKPLDPVPIEPNTAIPQRTVRVHLEELAMALLCVRSSVPTDRFLDKLRGDIDFLEAIDGCNK